MSDTKQLREWTGDFGNTYIKDNDYAEWKIPLKAKMFSRILSSIKVDSVLEVGSNVGINMATLNQLLDGDVKLYAVEPNKTAYDRLVANVDITGVEKAWNCDAFNLPLSDASVDLVFTSGVLIHIAPENLGKATDEIVRVADKYVLCIEYFSDEPEEKKYRGQNGLLFKRDFGAYYLDRFNDLECIDFGFVWKRDNELCGNTNWWLFKKKANQG